MGKIRWISLGFWLIGSLAGCARYAQQPLNTRSTLPDRIPDLTIDPRQMPMSDLAVYTFDPGDGLDMTEVAMLAVVNNPDLRVARANAGIAHAQAFSAGLLPDPQLSFGTDFPLSGVAVSNAFTIGLGADVIALLTTAPRRAAARQEAAKTDLNLLWQEWQVVSQARLLFVRLIQAQQLMQVLEQTRTLYADRYSRVQTALDRGLMTLNDVTPHLTALQDLTRQINDLERLVAQSHHDLNLLLGLTPEVTFPLVGPPALADLDDSRIEALLADLPRRRPDLLALQAGYAAQEQRVRAAIMAQFPSLTVGVARARDTSDVNTIGVGITLNLPLFSGNRGPIAVERATRQALFTEYQERLNAAGSGIRRILVEQRINQRQLREIDQGLSELTQVAAKTEAAFTARNIDALAFACMQAALLAKKFDRMTLAQLLLEQRVALQTLVGGQLPERP